jgi:hypothetical protein
VTPADLGVLKAYLAPWKPAANPSRVALKSDGKVESSPEAVPEAVAVALGTVRPELNGMAFDPAFETWKPISTTDRGDNNTFRFVLGNEIAVNAARSGNISPWPDGARFAKVAWQQAPGADGLVHPGKFVQVELMEKDAQRFKDTDGWGWGRWLGLDLNPYGKDTRFTRECTNCHLPMRGDDYVYTMPITAAQATNAEVVNNRAAALPANLPYQPLGWSAITLYVDPRAHTMATLYGNDSAMRAVQARGPAAEKAPAYPAGSVLALVTWAQRDDPHWFGARIPDVPQTVEFVQIAPAGQENAYSRFAGTGTGEEQQAGNAAQRVNFVLGLAPAPLP